MWWTGLIFAALWVAGCSSAKPPAQEVPEPPDPHKVLADQWAKGSYQVETASANLTDLHDDLSQAAKQSTGEQRESLLDVGDAVSSVGQQIAEFANAPSEAEIDKDFASADEDRLRAIKQINEALTETHEAVDLAKELPPDVAEAVTANLDEAARSLEDAIKAFGGQVKAPG
jgi:uncharacterized phage infection (PIP) family protein YhgE